MNWRIEVKPFFRWYDLWVGAYVDTSKKDIYVYPIPMIGIKISFKKQLTRKRVFVHTGYGIYSPVALIHTKHNYAVVPSVSYGVAGEGGAPWPLEYRNEKKEKGNKTILHHWADRRDYDVYVIDDPNKDFPFTTECISKPSSRMNFKEAYDMMMDHVKYMEKHT